MGKRILMLPDGGVGNKVQALGVYQSLNSHYGPTDMFDFEPGAASPFFKDITERHGSQYITDYAEMQTYEKIYAMRIKHASLNSRVIATQRTLKQSEVKENEQILHKLNVPNLPVKLDWPTKAQTYDVVIANGGTNTLTWIRKRYRRWNEIAKALIARHFTVASVGLPDEYIHPSIDLTKLSFMETVDHMVKARVILTNDCGLFHIAAALNRPTVVAFTATNPYKNTDEVFHRTADIVTPGLSCFPCQGNSDNFWPINASWGDCKDWKCGEMDSNIVLDTVLRRLGC